MKPHRTLSRVVLPAPFGPITPRTCRGGTASETASSAVSPPKRTVTSRASSTEPRFMNQFPRQYQTGDSDMNPHSKTVPDTRQDPYRVDADSWLNRDAEP